MIRLACALYPHEAGFAAWADYRVGLHHRVILLVYPALGADVGARQELLEISQVVAIFVQFLQNLVRRLVGNGRLPSADGPMIERRIVGERLVGDVGDEHAVMTNAQARFGLDRAHDNRVQAPLCEDAQDLFLSALFGHKKHSFLTFGKHNFVRRHPGFTLRHQVEFDIETDTAARAHLAGRAGQAGGAHVLNPYNRTRLHGFEAGFEEQLLHERIADLHIGPLLLRPFLELFAGHGGAVNAVAAGLGTHINHRVSGPGSLAVEDLVLAHHAERKSIHQWIAAVAGLELGFAAEIRNAKAVAITGDSADHSLDDGMILRNQIRLDTLVGVDRSEAKRIHHRQRPRAHGEDVAQNARLLR